MLGGVAPARGRAYRLAPDASAGAAAVAARPG